MTTHTPGPWHTDEGNFGTIGIMGADQKYLANIRVIGPKKQQGERYANARLIAAAPEMYEMLKDLAQTVNAGTKNRINALIAKIEQP